MPRILLLVSLLVGLAAPALNLSASADLPIYSDSLAAGWSDWSWNTVNNFNVNNPVHAGAAAISVQVSAAWGGLSLRSASPINTAGYAALDFWAYGGPGGATVQVYLQSSDSGPSLAGQSITFPAGVWTHYTVPLSSLGSPAAIARLNWQAAGGLLASFTLDDIRLIGASTVTPTATATRTAAPPTATSTPTRTAPPPTPTATRPASTPTQAPLAALTIYDDRLGSAWADWSWSVTNTFNNPAPIYSGSSALAVRVNAGWGGLSLRSAAFSTTGYSALDFWAYAGGANAAIDVFIQQSDTGAPLAKQSLLVPAGAWTHYTLPLSSLGSPAAIARLNWQATGGATPTFYLDEVRLTGSAPIASGTATPAPATATPPPAAGLSLSVDAALDRHAISPYIYGINQYNNTSATLSLMQELRIPVRRWGGNAASRYNYQNDVTNHVKDWYWENIKQSDATNLPADSAVNRYIDENRQVGADSFVTMPLIGYVANQAGRCSFPVSKYGAQTATDPWTPDCGSGVSASGANLSANPLDTSIAIGPTFVQGWINLLKSRYGSASGGGVRLYNLDNEPDLWWETHRDVAPEGLTYDGLRQRSLTYAAAIKAADPGAQVLGPAFGVYNYFFDSAYDIQRQDYATPDDRLAHGDAGITEWYLQQMRAYEQQNGVRLLDYLDLHYYPQGGMALTGAGDANLQAQRLRSTRSLWDPTYVDESWIGQYGPDGGVIRMIPRMRQWINSNYPGTKIAIGEYNWGALDHINGALAQADVLGIFGREGVDLATLWDAPQPNQPGAFAFRMYRNYNGQGGQFGETSVRALSADQSKLSVYAARRASDNALTIMVINKSGVDQPGVLNLANFSPAAPARLYRYSPANLSAILALPDVTLSGSTGFSFPANSITLIVVSSK